MTGKVAVCNGDEDYEDKTNKNKTYSIKNDEIAVFELQVEVKYTVDGKEETVIRSCEYRRYADLLNGTGSTIMREAIIDDGIQLVVASSDRESASKNLSNQLFDIANANADNVDKTNKTNSPKLNTSTNNNDNKSPTIVTNKPGSRNASNINKTTLRFTSSNVAPDRDLNNRMFGIPNQGAYINNPFGNQH